MNRTELHQLGCRLRTLGMCRGDWLTYIDGTLPLLTLTPQIVAAPKVDLPKVKTECPTCASRRKKKAQAQKRWRQAAELRRRPNPFEDAARGRDPAPKNSGGGGESRPAIVGQCATVNAPHAVRLAKSDIPKARMGEKLAGVAPSPPEATCNGDECAYCAGWGCRHAND